MNSEEPHIPPTDVSAVFRRRLQFPRFQLVGIALLMAIPVLALMGVFGPDSHKVVETAPGLEMNIEYPSRFRYKTVSPLDVAVKNNSATTIPSLTVSFDRFYISRFSDVQFTPSPESVTGADYRVQFTNIAPGEIRRVSVSLQGERYGFHQGSVSALTGKGSSLRVPIQTFVFP